MSLWTVGRAARIILTMQLQQLSHDELEDLLDRIIDELLRRGYKPAAILWGLRNDDRLVGPPTRRRALRELASTRRALGGWRAARRYFRR